MTTREPAPGWTINDYDGEFEPMAFGPKNDVSMDVNDDDTITIEHDVSSDYFSGSRAVRVTVPIRWVTEMVAVTLAFRAQTQVKP